MTPNSKHDSKLKAWLQTQNMILNLKHYSKFETLTVLISGQVTSNLTSNMLISISVSVVPAMTKQRERNVGILFLRITWSNGVPESTEVSVLPERKNIWNYLSKPGYLGFFPQWHSWKYLGY